MKIESGERQSDEKEVYADLSLPFEAPAKEFVPGPYYKSVDELMPDLASGEDKTNYSNFALRGSPDLAVDRRDFMRLFSASAVMASTACIRRPAEKAIPYTQQPIDQIPGVPTYFATTCNECVSACGVVVKTREGRPVKVEGSPEHPISQGATCATGQATLQGLYHPERRKKPVLKRGKRVDNAEWDEILETLSSRIKNAKNVAILTGGSTGHRHDFFRSFLRQVGMPEANLYTYEPNALISSITQAHKIAFGAEGMPRPDIRVASMVVGIGSDFLEVGISPVYMAKSFAAARNLKAEKMTKFVQFEATMTQTGAKADERHVIPPGFETAATLMLVQELLANSASKGGAGERSEIQRVLSEQQNFISEAEQKIGVPRSVFKDIADQLVKEKAVVLCGGSANFDKHSTTLQLAAIMANVLIGAYGSTLQFDKGWMIAPVVPGDLNRFISDAAKIDLLLVIDNNPVFTVPKSFGLESLLTNIKDVVSIQSQPTETDAFASIILPAHHYLESWGDEQSVAGFWSARQPAVRPLTDSRQPEDMLLWICAHLQKPMPYADYREYLKAKWKSLHALLGTQTDYDTFFLAVLRRGFVGRISQRTVRGVGGLSGQMHLTLPPAGLTLLAPLDSRLREGGGAHKPVLQEVGDSMTTVTWDTWVALNPNTAKQLKLRMNDVVRVEGPGGSFEAAVYPLPGLHPDAVVVPRGNGHQDGVSKITDGVGVNPLAAVGKEVDLMTNEPAVSVQAVKLTATGKHHRLAAMQKHNDIANRSDIVKKVSYSDWQKNANKTVDLDTVPDLYPALEVAKYRWGMSVDLNLCTGCSACMVACAQENNVAQVGREQILTGREMHWIRLDRYFAGDVDNPEVTYQPVMCQHCNHAPCEAVCPVYATTHDKEGINGQTYNRCVGTRYCANACPYKVRRFNWFTHQWNNIGAETRDRSLRALNPDVTVRTRGIMEKCTFCIQRIRDGKHRAAERDARVNDGDVQTACQQACPSNAITFGDLLDSRSTVARLRKDARAYLMLGGDPEHKHYGIKTVPNVSYLAQVTLKEQVAHNSHSDKGEAHHE